MVDGAATIRSLNTAGKAGALVDQTEHISVLQELFGCDASTASILRDNLKIVTAPAAVTLAFQGDPSTDCRFVVSGAIGMRALSEDGQYTQIATAETGEVVGAFPHDCEHSVELVTQEAAEMIVIGTAQLRALAQEHSGIGLGLASLFAQQLSNVLGQMAAHVTLTAYGRVYQALLDMADKDGIISPAPIVTALGVKTQTARETASRAVSDLCKTGGLTKSKQHWMITSRRMLEDMVI